MPSDIASHVLHTTPRVDFEPISDAVPLLNLDNLSLLNKYGKDGTKVFLTAVEDPTTFPDWVLGETPDADGALHNSTACAVVAVEHQIPSKENVLDVFYFYFYSWNEGGDITQVEPPLNKLFPDSKPGDHFGNHLGDWEHNMIRFINEEPVGIYFSHHSGGDVCAWKDGTCLTKRGGRPTVFSARGSHANYPSEGSHTHDDALIDIADKGRLWDPISQAYLYTYDPKTETFIAAEPGNAPIDWLYFNGNWGDERYRDSDPRQYTVPYFGLKKFDSGPNGPKFKHLVRKELVPDGKPETSLMKTLVHWYMGWYGCCLKGINPWVVIVSLLLALAVLIAVCVFAVRLGRPRLKTWLLNRKAQDSKKDTSDVQLRLLDPEGLDAEDEG
jgi:amino acid transporter